MKKTIVIIAVMSALCVLASAPVAAGVLLASYEPGEDVVPAGLNINDCVVTPVLASSVGLSATHGVYILELSIDATDGKIEFDHTWTTSTYDLAGETEMYLDVYVTSSATLPTVVGMWDPLWAPPDSFQATSNLPVVGEWTTLTYDVSTREQTGLTQIWATIFENMPAPATGTIYIDFLRLGEVAALIASDPTPGDASAVSSSVSELSWINPASAGTITCDVWLSNEPNDVLWTVADLLEDDLVVTPDTLASATIAPALIDNETYYWRVDVTDSITGEAIGNLWSFSTTNNPPVVDAGPKQNAWLKGGTVTVQLDGTVTDDSLPNPPGAMDLTWTGAIFSDDKIEDPTVTFTSPGSYTLTLSADDGLYTIPPTQYAAVSQDTVVITVYAEGTADTDHLVAMWDFEGDALDDIGGHDGTLVGETYVNADDAMVGTGSVIFGTDGVVNIEDSGVADPNYNPWGNVGAPTWADFTDEVSVTAWMKTSGFTQAWQFVLDKGLAYGIQRNDNSNNVMFRISQYPNEERSVRGALDVTAVGTNDGWHHIAGTFDGATVRLYVDGWLEAEADASIYDNAIPRDGGFLSLGGFEGRMDNVRIYDIGLDGQVVLDQYIADGGGASCGQIYEYTDLNLDCYTNLADVALLAIDWLKCGDITNSNCD